MLSILELSLRQQLINLAIILEAVVIHLTEDGSKSEKGSVYTRIDLLFKRNCITNETCINTKSLWADRRQIHLHLIDDNNEVDYSNENYTRWHRAVASIIHELT